MIYIRARFEIIIRRLPRTFVARRGLKILAHSLYPDS